MQHLAILPVLATLAWMQVGEMTPPSDALANDRVEAHRLAADFALGHLADAADTRAFVHQLDELARDNSHRDSVRTILLHDGLVALANLPPVAELEPWLHGLALQDRSIPVWHADEGHAVETSIYDVGAAARFALAGWSRQRAYAEAVGNLRNGSLDISTVFGPGGHRAQRDGYARAFDTATNAELAGVRDTVAAALGAGLPVEALAATVATRLQDRGLAGLLIERGDGSAMQTLLRPLVDAFPAYESFALVESATRRNDIGSIAVAEIGRLAGDLVTARVWLLQQLGEPATGAAAALALAQVDHPTLVTELEYELSKGSDTMRRSRAALALQLNGTPAARAALQRFADEAAPDDALQSEVRRWLR